MHLPLLALASGLLSLRLLPALPPAWSLWLLLPLALMCLPYRSYPVGLFLLGFVWACTSAHFALDDRLSPAWDGRTVWLEGRVSDLPDQRDGVVRFQLESPVSRRGDLPDRLRLAWYDGPEVRSGEYWRLAVRLKSGRGLVNPAGFDYEAWLLAQRIGATGTVKTGRRLGGADGPLSWRDDLRRRLLETNVPRAGGLAALVVGDGSGIAPSEWTVLQHTGTTHLMVISGQHVSMVAGLVFVLFAGLVRGGGWPAHWPWIPVACLSAFAAALVYGALAGFEVPVRRACLMLGFVLLWRWRFRQVDGRLVLLVALTVVLMLEPLASLQPGFWLSFAAVAILAAGFGARLGSWRWWQVLGRAQWLVALGLLPAMLALGLPVSVSGPLANLIAVPWVGTLVVPLALLGCLLLPVPGVGQGLLHAAGWMLDVLFDLLAWLASAMPAWLPAGLPLWGWLLLLLGTGLLLLPAGVPLRALGLPLLLPLLAPPLALPAKGQADVWMFDVGQGLSVLVRTEGHALLYDAAPRYADFDLGERVVLPSLRSLGVSALDRMHISHADSDHAGGAVAIQAAMPVGLTSSGEPGRLPTVLAAQPCGGEEWTWDDVRFSTWRHPGTVDGNAASCVLRVEANGERLLLVGDIDVSTERLLLDSGFPLRAEWLQLGHHGSRTSSSGAFLQAVAPGEALISRGHGNSFGHPHPEVMSRLARMTIRAADTAQRGALHIRLGAYEPAVGLRETPRFWRQK